MQQLYGYYTSTGYVGYVNGKPMQFSTYDEYVEYTREEEDD